MARMNDVTVKMEDGREVKLTPQQVRKAMLEQEKAARAGSMIGPGVMWCPNCGSLPASNGHQTCRDCDPDFPMTVEEFRALSAQNELEQRLAREAGQIDDEAVEDGDSGDGEDVPATG